MDPAPPRRPAPVPDLTRPLPFPRIRVLGPVELIRPDGTLEPLGSTRTRVALAALTAAAGDVVSADRLADLLWGVRQPANPVAALQTVISRLRARLAAVGLTDRLLTRAPGYLLRLEPADCDATLVVELTAQAEHAPTPAVAADLLDRALALWRDPAYAEFADLEFAGTAAGWLAHTRSTAAERRIDAALGLGRTAEAIGFAEAEIARNPLLERPRAQLMLALWRAGRQPEALTVFRTYRELLDEELGLEPTDELIELHQQVLRRDPLLAPPAPDRRGSPRSTGNLPATRNALVGREAELAALDALLAAERLVTVTGPGGVGKTQLALTIAAEVAATGDRPDGIWLIELAALRRDATIADAISTVLGVSAAGVTSTQRLLEYLGTQRCLLILDNGEHLVDALAPVVQLILDRCPLVTVLVTSQLPLGLPSETISPLAPLAVDAGDGPAVELFVRRATRLAPEFAPTPADLRQVAEVCRLLDGLPLAIELAAARMRHLTPGEVLQRMPERFRLLRSADRSAAERHRTLRGVVAWSYELLDPAEQALFDCLSVFRGSFGYADASAVSGVPMGELTDGLGSLVDRSMVRAAAGPAGTMFSLLETLRAFGAERLRSRGAEQVTRRAFATQLLQLVRRGATAVAGDCGPWVREVAARFDDLRAAHGWAVDNDLRLALQLVTGLADWVEFQMPAELVEWAESTARRSIAADPAGSDRSLTIVALGMASAGERFGGDLNRALRLADEATALVQDPADPVLRFPLYLRSEIDLYRGRLTECIATAQQVTPLAERAGDLLRAKWSVMNQVLALAYGGDRAAALNLAEGLVAAGDHSPISAAWSDYTLGEVLMDVDPERSLVLLERAVDQARQLSDRFLTGVALLSAASVRARHGEPAAAIAMFRDVVEHWHRIGNWTQRWTTFRTVAELLARLDDTRTAAVLVGAARAETRPAQVYGSDADRLDTLQAQLRRRLGDPALDELLATGTGLSDDAAFELVRQALARHPAGVGTADQSTGSSR